MKKKPLILLVGPTAVGKTSISIEIAKRLNAEIISADSMQIYKHMDIGTAKIKEQEKEGVKHYLIDIVYPNEKFTVSDYQKKAKECIDEILNKKKLPMLVGGTGLYVNSIVYDLDFTKAISNPKLRNKYNELAEIHGNEYLHEKLKKIDPKSANKIHINDRKRIIRALEVYHETGKPMSEYNKNFRKPNPTFELAFIGLTMNRKKLYDRINKRVELMIKEGLLDEVKNLLKMGYRPDSTALQGLGYKEIIKYFNNEYTYKEAIRILKRDTRRFAKRQITWFRRDKRIKWINLDLYDDNDKACKAILSYVSKKLNNNTFFKDITSGGDYFEK
ncbi:tRNA (adenosine(37)-N6)-dimethylallyltransferase MiaA [Caldisalinibacter kiritimatiensis]|uniref:tRNA dimethylallyltransferase n=1 Tax=Caldisalinibacter kiritimatiensis TaxID=1304284 RepID=R1CWQ7_9FIRM|nr:tRNA delta(2)-isopentenylpyrophosphate transferase [Caldisalinibacter kiritimatiensis]